SYVFVSVVSCMVCLFMCPASARHFLWFRFGFCSSSSDFPVSSFCTPLPLFLCVSKVFRFWSRLRALWLNVCCLLRPPGISSGLDLAFCSSSCDFPVSSFCPPLPLFLCVSKVLGLRFGCASAVLRVSAP